MLVTQTLTISVSADENATFKLFLESSLGLK